jgi:two-component system, sensor histidine kinase
VSHAPESPLIPYRSSIGVGSDETDRLAAARSVRLRATQSIHTGPIVAGIAIAVGGLFAWMGGGWPSLVWGAIVAAAAIVNQRMCVPIAAMPEDAPPAEVGRAEERLWWLTVMNTIAVGAGIWLNSLQTEDPPLLFLVTMLLALYSLGALINASTHPPTFATGAWINFGSMIAYWATHSDVGWAPALALTGLGLLMTRFSMRISQDFIGSVRISREKDVLLERLRSETEAAQQARRAAEEASLSKSRFLAAASHDLRQPLHTLMLFSSLLERGNAENRQQFVQHIQSAAASLDKLFSGLLDLSKLDAGAVSASVTEVGLHALVEPVVGELSVAAAQKGLSLHLRIDECLRVRTDPFLFERVLRNLIDNAIKYTERGEVEVTAAVEAPRVLLAVRDTGSGIPATDLERVFDEFHQLRNPNRAPERGSGLGLAIVRRLCELLGHRIELRSAEGAGSTFTVALELVDGTAAAPDAPQTPAGRGTAEPAAPDSLDVLVLDDDHRVRIAMTEMLLAWRCRPHVFETTEALLDALASWRGPPPAALIADYRLGGGGDGFDAVARARTLCPGLPAAIVTGDLETADRGPDRAADVAVYRKPVSERTLAAWLRRSVSERAPGDAPER